MQVNEWAGDTLRLTFDRYAIRRLALALPPDSAQHYSAEFTPAAVSFRGPASLVNSLPNPYPVSFPHLRAEEASTEAEVRITCPARVRPSVERVTVRVAHRLRPDAGRGRRRGPEAR